jgi:hypothetical protein
LPLRLKEFYQDEIETHYKYLRCPFFMLRS